LCACTEDQLHTRVDVSLHQTDNRFTRRLAADHDSKWLIGDTIAICPSRNKINPCSRSENERNYFWLLFLHRWPNYIASFCLQPHLICHCLVPGMIVIISWRIFRIVCPGSIAPPQLCRSWLTEPYPCNQYEKY